MFKTSSASAKYSLLPFSFTSADYTASFRSLNRFSKYFFMSFIIITLSRLDYLYEFDLGMAELQVLEFSFIPIIVLLSLREEERSLPSLRFSPFLSFD